MTNPTSENDYTVPVVIDATILFEREHCRCCDCCEGYCPDFDVPHRWQPLFTFTAAGRDYIGDARIMVRRDLLEGLPDEPPTLAVVPSSVSLDWATIPDEKPPLFTGRHVARYWDAFERTDLVCHQGPGQMVHLYLNDQHVGWSTHAKPGKGIEQHELLQVREVATRLYLGLNEAAAAIQAVEEVRRG